MPIDYSDLLEAYYSHLQHTEKERNHFLEIFLAIAGGGLIIVENVLPKKIKFIFYVFMTFASVISYNILYKMAIVARGYSISICQIIGDNRFNVFKNMKKKSPSMSKLYTLMMALITLLYAIMSLIYFNKICDYDLFLFTLYFIFIIYMLIVTCRYVEPFKECWKNEIQDCCSDGNK